MLLFPRKQEVIDIQVKLIDTFGGIHGLKDQGALESALAASENRVYYELDIATGKLTRDEVEQIFTKWIKF